MNQDGRVACPPCSAELDKFCKPNPERVLREGEFCMYCGCIWKPAAPAVRVGPRCNVFGCEHISLSGEASGLGSASQGFTIERIVEGDTFWFCPQHADAAEQMQEQGTPAELICSVLAARKGSSRS